MSPFDERATEGAEGFTHQDGQQHGDAVPPIPLLIIKRADIGPGDNQPRLSKRIIVGENGRPEKQAAAAMTAGRARLERVDGAGLVELLRQLGQDEALALGQPVDPRAKAQAVAGSMVILTKTRAKPPESWARTGEHIGRPAGSPGWLPVDIDPGDITPEMRDRIDREFGGDVIAAIVSVCPAVLQAERVTRPSVSAGVVDAAGAPVFGAGGKHIYIAIKDSADARRATDVLAARLRLAGFGGCRLSKAGQVLVRQLIDASVAGGERLMFEGAPLVEVPGLHFDPAGRAAPVLHQGGLLDTRVAMPDLTEQESAQDRVWKRQERERLRPEAEALGAKWARQKGEEARQRARAAGASEEAAAEAGRAEEARCRARWRGVVLGSDVLPFDDPEMAGTTVAAVLDDSQQFHLETLRDPVEPEHGPNKAVIYGHGPDGTGHPRIFSHARGGGLYWLRHDRATLEARVRRAGVRAVDRLIDLLPISEIDLHDGQALADIAADVAGVRRRDAAARFKTAWKAQRDGAKFAAATEQAQAAQDAATAETRRSILLPPNRDHELRPVVQQIGQALGDVDRPDMLMNQQGTGLVAVQEMDSGLDLHRLEDDEEGDGAERRREPAPPSVGIVRPRPEAIAVRLERDIAFLRPDSEGVGLLHVAAPPRVVAALAAEPPPEVPRLRGITGSPLIMLQQGGARPYLVLNRPGLDRASGTFLASSSEFCRLALPVGWTDADVIAAARYLDGELKDVLFGTALDRVKAVAAMLTLAYRTRLPICPIIIVSSGRRGTGKTTLVNIMSVAATGFEAGAATWTDDPDEQRKLLLAAALEGRQVLFFDNVPRGHTIRGAALEAAATSAFVSGRVLGESRSVTVRNSAAIVITGNNVTTTADLVSRALSIRLTTDDPAVELREVQHRNIVGRFQANRPQIVRAMLTLGAAGMAALPSRLPVWPRSRFPGWDRIVGRAAAIYGVLAQGLAPEELVLIGDPTAEAEEGSDDSRDALLLAWLHRTFHGARFTTDDLVARLPTGFSWGEDGGSAAQGDVEQDRAAKGGALFAETVRRLRTAQEKRGSLRVMREPDAAGFVLRGLKGNAVEIEPSVVALLENAPRSRGTDRTYWWVALRAKGGW